MVVPAYTNVAHFRAPYKNSYVYTGVGQEPPVGPPPAPLDPFAQYVDTNAKGQRRYNPTAATVLKGNLILYRAVFVNDRAITIAPFTPEELAAAKASPNAAAMLEASSAATFVKQKLREGNVVFAAQGVFIEAVLKERGLFDLFTPAEFQVRASILAVPANEEAAVTQTSKTFPILAEPSLLAGLISTPAGFAVGAVALGALGLAIYKGVTKKKRASPMSPPGL